MLEIDFIPRKFSKNKTFDDLIKESTISILLGETGSGKTYQLKHYYDTHPNNSKYIELVTLSDEDIIDKSIDVVLLDSLDEALFFQPSDKVLIKKISRYILKCKQINKNVKFVISCRYSEWKKVLYINELKRIFKPIKLLYKEEKYFYSNIKIEYKDIKTYEFENLNKEDINKILKQQRVESDNPVDKLLLIQKDDKSKIKDFWEFATNNYLTYQNNLYIKNIQIILYLIENFRQYKNLKYYEIYQNIIEQHLLLETSNERYKQLNKISLNEMLKIASIIERTRIQNNKKYEDISTSKLIKFLTKDIPKEKLNIIFDTALYLKNQDFFISDGNVYPHDTNPFSAYLCAYDLKQLDIQKIKKITQHKYGVAETYESVFVHLVNIKPKLFNEFSETNPFIFKQHFELDYMQQKKLFISILKILKETYEPLERKKEYFNYPSSLIHFSKDINIEDILRKEINSSNLNKNLGFYLLYLRKESYLLELLKELVSTEQDKVDEIIRFSLKGLIFDSSVLNLLWDFFTFMKDNNLFKKDNFEFTLYSFFYNSNKIFPDYCLLLDYIDNKTLEQLTKEELLLYFEYINKNHNEKQHSKNLIFSLFSKLLKKNLSIVILNQLISFLVQKNIYEDNISFSSNHQQKFNKHRRTIKNFWKIFFSSKRDEKYFYFLFSVCSFSKQNIEEIKEEYSSPKYKKKHESLKPKDIIHPWIEQRHRREQRHHCSDKTINDLKKMMKNDEKGLKKKFIEIKFYNIEYSKNSIDYEAKDAKCFINFFRELKYKDIESFIDTSSMYKQLFKLSILEIRSDYYYRVPPYFISLSQDRYSSLFIELIIKTFMKKTNNQTVFIDLRKLTPLVKNPKINQELNKFIKEIPKKSFFSLNNESKRYLLEHLIKNNDDNTFKYIQNLMESDKSENCSIYLQVLSSIDENKTNEAFMGYYRKDKQDKQINIYNSLDSISKNRLKVEDIKELIIDFYSTFNKEPSINIDYLWSYLNDKNILNELSKEANFQISSKAKYELKNIYNDEVKSRDFKEILEKYSNSNKPLIITEGKTDWKHLKKALERFKNRGEYIDLDIQFSEYEDDISMSDSELVSMVISYSKTLHSKKHIMIFDRDATQKKDIKKIFEKENSYNSHGNNVYSIFIPEIDNKLNEICIEFYYKQEEVKKAWYEGKRLFYGNEFNKKTQISICGKYKTDKPYPKSLDILDGDNKKKVYLIDDEEKKENNIALSKNNFAENILNEVEGFDNFDIKHFESIFDMIERIVND